MHVAFRTIKAYFHRIRGNKYIRLNGFLLLFSVLVLFLIETFYGNVVLRKDRETSTRLIFDILRQQIERELDSSLDVLMTMERDIFLREFLEQEEASPEAFSGRMARYLTSFGERGGWERAYFSSARSLRYYTPEGFGTVLEEGDPYDQWYFSFIRSGKDYWVDIQDDLFNQGVWTIFVDRRMEDVEGNLLGVCTVGIRMEAFIEHLSELERDYDVGILFVDREGEVQINSDRLRDSQLYKEVDYSDRTGEVFLQDTQDACLISQYNPLLGWHLVVENQGNLYSAFFPLLTYFLFGVLALFLFAAVVNTIVSSRQQDELLNRAETDPLTKVYNRAGIEKRVRAVLDDQTSSNREGTLFLVDLDHFKQVNDTLGHAVGDEVLVRTGEILAACFRKGDIIGRMGGDEFLVFCPGMKGEETIRLKAELVNTSGRYLVEREGQEVDVSMSIGIAIAPVHDTLYEGLYKKADSVLYTVKKEGGDGYRIYGDA